MKTSTKKVVECSLKDTAKPVLSVIVNKGVVVSHKNLPLSCRYCELRWENMPCY